MLLSMKRQKYCTARKKNMQIVWYAKINAYLCIRNNNNNILKHTHHENEQHHKEGDYQHPAHA